MDETIDPGLDASERLDVFQPIDPFRELMGFDAFLHTHNVAHGLLLARRKTMAHGFWP